MFEVMEFAYWETQEAMKPQHMEHLATWLNSTPELDDTEAYHGIISRRYMEEQPDNDRFDGGFWGNTKKFGSKGESHNQSKAKGFKGWR